MVSYLRAANVLDGTLDLTDVKTMNFSPIEQQHYRLRSGDVLVTEGSGSLSTVGASAVWRDELSEVVCFQNTLLRLRPRSEATDRRFLAWWAQFAFNDGLFASLATGANIWHLSAEKVRSLPVHFPREPTQQRIADFLDSETARIDALIAKKRRLIELASLRVWKDFETTVEGLGVKWVPIRRCIRSINDGPFGSAFRAEDYSETGAFVVRLGNIGFGTFRDKDGAYIPLELYSHFLRHRVRAGDLLIAGLGDDNNHAGRACVAPNLGRAIVKGKCFCAQIDADMADSDYLALFLSSRLGAEAIGVEARGSTRTMINLEIAKAATLPLPPLQRQREIVERFRLQMSRAGRLVDILSRQLDLLAEHRQAIITAAVTGEIEVPRTVSS